MKPLRLVVPSVLFASAIAACSQPDDVPALQEEATQLAKSYQARFDELEHRAHEMKGPALAQTTMRTFQQGVTTIGEYKNLLRQVPLRIQAGVKNHQPEELQKLIDELHLRFEDGVIEASTAITAVEDQAALARHGLAPLAQAAPAAQVRPHAEAADGTANVQTQ